jgi:predicted neutral ceramidase superfamily lipid hydrolase
MSETKIEQNLVRVRVQSVQRARNGLFVIESNNETKRLSASDVNKIQRVGEQVFIWITDEIYHHKFHSGI